MKFRQASNCCEKILEAAKRIDVDETKESITSKKHGSRDFRRIANSALKKGKFAVSILFYEPKVLFSAFDKAKLFAANFLKNSLFFPSRTNLELHNIHLIPKFVKPLLQE